MIYRIVWYFQRVQTFDILMNQPASVKKKWTGVEIDDVIMLAVSMRVLIQIVWTRRLPTIL